MPAGLAVQTTIGVEDLPICPWAGLAVLAAWVAGAVLAAWVAGAVLAGWATSPSATGSVHNPRVHVSMGTSAGKAGKPNEDFAGAVPGAVVLLDGAGIPGTESICSHGVAWYTHRLGGVLLGRLSRDDGEDLATILAAAIAEIAADHGGTCDIGDPSSPQATVALVRAHRGRLDYLLLADSFLVLDRAGGPEVITDEREVAARRSCSAPLDGVPPGTPEYDRIRAACVGELRARRNQPGGYWIAKDDPRAAQEAVIGSRTLPDLDGVALLSNGASRIVSPYGVTDWPGVLELLRGHGPADLIRRVREVEASAAGPDAPVPDDATVVHGRHRPSGTAPNV